MPSNEPDQKTSEFLYAGFWIRLAAALIDTLLVLLAIGPVLTWMYGLDYWSWGREELVLGVWDVLLKYVLPVAVVILFWLYRAATPGKIWLKMRIVDARRFSKPSAEKLVGRYFSYYLSLIPFGLGFLWIAFDARKQGWHDKLAGTVVVVERKPSDGDTSD